MFFSLHTLSFFVIILSLRQVASWQIGDKVRTTSGLVQGRASSWQPDVGEYLGIRYAHPPVSELRFAYPRPYRSDGVISALKYFPDCPANAGIAAGS
jgi:cholinesterase